MKRTLGVQNGRQRRTVGRGSVPYAEVQTADIPRPQLLVPEQNKSRTAVLGLSFATSN